MAQAFDPAEFNAQVLQRNGINCVFGVPDSSISGLLSFFAVNKTAPEHVVTANEGAAVAIAAGCYLSSGQVAMAYMQNSGLSNALNPLQSVASKEVFGIPMLLMIGWRGMPGIKDEPQHALIGPRLTQNLEANKIPFKVIPETIEGARTTVQELVRTAVQQQTPVALIMPPKSFREYQYDTSKSILASPTTVGKVVGKLDGRLCSVSGFPLTREAAIRCILASIAPKDITVSSLGGNSRELYMIRKEKEQSNSLGSNFFCIGGMGHTYALAYGVAAKYKSGRVVCIDGDGSFIMHAGNNAVLAGVSPKHLVHVVIYNGMHSSTGAQPLMLSKHHLLGLADGLPYEQKLVVQTQQGLEEALAKSTNKNTVIVVGVNAGVRDNLPRPTESPRELKQAFMSRVSARL